MELRIVLPVLMMTVAASLSGAVDSALRPQPGFAVQPVDGSFALLKMSGPDGRSPALSWSEPPPSTRTLAIVAEDLDAEGADRVFWAVWNLSRNVRYLEGGVPASTRTASGALQATTEAGVAGYRPPSFRAAARHRLRLTLFAVPRTLALPDGATGEDVLRAASEAAGVYAVWHAGGGWIARPPEAVAASRQSVRATQSE
jgi:phosphatidylethanolamine-binding protein (PEBP) family uncharacterized protein